MFRQLVNNPGPGRHLIDMLENTHREPRESSTARFVIVESAVNQRFIGARADRGLKAGLLLHGFFLLLLNRCSVCPCEFGVINAQKL